LLNRRRFATSAIHHLRLVVVPLDDLNRLIAVLSGVRAGRIADGRCPVSRLPTKAGGAALVSNPTHTLLVHGLCC
jgi:hypothetical protein